MGSDLLLMLRWGMLKDPLNEVVSILITRNWSGISIERFGFWKVTYCQSKGYEDDLYALHRRDRDISLEILRLQSSNIFRPLWMHIGPCYIPQHFGSLYQLPWCDLMELHAHFATMSVIEQKRGENNFFFFFGGGVIVDRLFLCKSNIPNVLNAPVSKLSMCNNVNTF